MYVGEGEFYGEVPRHHSDWCPVNALGREKIYILCKGGSDLSLAMKKLKLIGLFMNSAF